MLRSIREWHVRDWMSPPTDAASESPKEEFILDASGHETRRAIHLVLTLRDGTTGTYLWSESLTLTLEIGTSHNRTSCAASPLRLMFMCRPSA